MNRWHLSDAIRNKFKPLLQEYFKKVETITMKQMENIPNEELGLNLSDMGINPSQLIDLLEEFGYEETDRNDNGWELDFWITMERQDEKCFNSGCERLVVSGCGMTFELKLWIDGIDF